MPDGIKNIMVSVIIPVYNGEKYLRECLDSVLAQSYNELEIIVVNDGSTDGSWRVIQEYAAVYNGIKPVCQENQGISSARNRGLEQAKGDYVMFLDCDDILRQEGVELLLRRAEEENSDLVIGNLMYFYHESRRLERPGRFLKDGVYKGRDKLKLVHLNPFVVNKLWKREVVLAHQLWFEPFVIGEDASFYLRFLTFAARISLLEACVSYYRLSDSSVIHTWSMKQTEALNVYDRMEFFYREQGGMEEYIRELEYDRLFFCCNTIRRLPSCKDGALRRQLMDVLLEKGSVSFSALPEEREDMQRLKRRLLWYRKHKGVYSSNICSACYGVARKVKRFWARRNGNVGERI